MSIRVEISQQTCEYLEKMSVGLASQKSRVAVDALLNNFVYLQEITTRIEQRLLRISQGQLSLTSELRLLINDCWTALDSANRVFVLTPKVGMLPTRKIESAIKLLAQARNSFQHVEDRIEHFLGDNQGSVYGDLYWRHRPSLQEPEKGFLYKGLRFGTPETGFDYGTINLPSPNYATAVGIYDLQLFYLEGNRKGTVHQPLIISIDEQMQNVNGFLDALVKSCQGLESSLESQGKRLFNEGIPPYVMWMGGGGNNVL